MVHGDKRRKVQDAPRITKEAIALKCYDMSERDSALVVLLYLSGRRISEVLALRKHNFRIEGNRISFDTFNAKVFRLKKTGNYMIEVKGDFLRKIRDSNGLTIKEEYYDTRYYEKIDPHFRINTPASKSLGFFILRRLGSLKDSEFIFKADRTKEERPISYGWAYQIIRYYFPDIWPHLLRHERFTEIFQVYKDDLMSAHRYTFHKRFESNLPYIRPLEIEKERI